MNDDVGISGMKKLPKKYIADLNFTSLTFCTEVATTLSRNGTPQRGVNLHLASNEKGYAQCCYQVNNRSVNQHSKSINIWYRGEPTCGAASHHAHNASAVRGERAQLKARQTSGLVNRKARVDSNNLPQV